MKKQFLTLALASLTALLVAQSPPPPPTPTPTAHKEQQQGASEKTTSNQTPQPTARPNVVGKHAKAHRDKSGDKSSTDRWIAIFTGILTLVGILQFSAMWRQSKYMRDGLRETKRAADASTKAALAAEDSVTLSRETRQLDQRAWIGAVSVSGVPILNQLMSFRVVIQNSGKTLAKNVQIDSVAYISAVEQGPPEFVIDKEGKPDKSPVAGSGLLMPNKTFSTGYLLKNAGVVIEGNMKALKEGRIIVWLHGKVFYEDIFGERHWTKYCFQMDTDFSFIACENGNDAT